MTENKALCSICGEPMPEGEEMFKFHGYSGGCPKPPLPLSSTSDKSKADLGAAYHVLKDALIIADGLAEADLQAWRKLEIDTGDGEYIERGKYRVLKVKEALLKLETFRTPADTVAIKREVVEKIREGLLNGFCVSAAEVYEAENKSIGEALRLLDSAIKKDVD